MHRLVHSRALSHDIDPRPCSQSSFERPSSSSITSCCQSLFTVAPHTAVEWDAATELVGESTMRITVFDYHADDGLVVALTEHEG